MRENGSEREASMVEREAVGRSIVKCPNGCAGDPRPVISDDPTVDRFQCSRLDCLRNFSVPKAGFGRPPRRASDEEEAIMADLKCAKCGREYTHPKRLANHEASCGGDAAGATSEATTAAPRRERTKPRAKARTKAPVQRRSGAINNALDLLRLERDEMIESYPKLRALNEAIKALEGVGR